MLCFPVGILQSHLVCANTGLLRALRELLEMTRPPQLPHLNPCEMIWDELDCTVKAKDPVQQPRERLQNC